MYTLREIDLPEDGRAVLERFAAAGRTPARGVWERLKAAAALDRKFVADRAARARAALERGVCGEVRVSHETPPALSEHEHGVFAFVPAGPAATLLLDISSVSDDPRWPLYEGGGLLRSEWRWLRFDGLDGCWCFDAAGAPIAPLSLPFFHDTALERRLTEEMDWPGDDAIVPLSMAEVEALARA